MADLTLSASQDIFLNKLPTKYRAYVGGFGCVHPDTKIHTNEGLKRIADIDSATQVLSWNEKSQKFQLSLSGGSFPKGKGTLYRVVTQQGEFVSSGHHRVFSSENNYVRVDSLQVGQQLNSHDLNLLSTISESYPLSSLLDVQHYSKTDEDYLVSYADAARQYGLQLHSLLDGGQASVPLLSGVRKLYPHDDQGENDHSDDQSHSSLKHSRLCQFFDRKHKSHLAHQLQSRSFDAADHVSTLNPEHISESHQIVQQSLPKSEHHHNIEQHSFVDHSSSSFKASSTKTVSITRIDVLEEEVYYDMQVLDTNNYVDESGCIHHNSGKSFVGCLDMLIFFSKHPKTVQGYFAPSYGAIRDIFFPTFSEAAEALGFTVDIKTSNKEVHVYRNGFYYGTVICRSMDNPSSIVGYKVSRGIADEMDTLPKDKAKAVWQKIIARLRLVIDGVENSIGVTTTPEGFMWVYETFANEPTKSYSMVQASTYENAKYLPPDYIETLFETYPEELARAYINGEFVNLTSGSVYRNYDKERCNSYETIKGRERLYIGQDFNVNQMASVIHVKRGNEYHAVDELVDLQDTPDVIRHIKEEWPDNPITIYPDSSGKNASSKNASVSDIGLLREAGFTVLYKSTNPFVKDRVLAMNTALDKGLLRVNYNRCPEYSKCLEQQAYDKNGAPDKTSGTDHMVDAGGYLVAYEHPVNKPRLRSVEIVGGY